MLQKVMVNLILYSRHVSAPYMAIIMSQLDVASYWYSFIKIKNSFTCSTVHQFSLATET
jgi:hypothetical protein